MTTAQNNAKQEDNTNRTASGFRAPQPKPGLNIAPPSFFRRLRRSVGGTVAYLASWWRY
jgi:hypothetical protein